MIVKSKIYDGPKAIFDPEYIPPELLYRKKEQMNLFSLLNDTLSENFSLNILYQGIMGIGKKVIVNKVLKDLLLQNKDFLNFHKISIDCKEKTIEDLVFSLLTDINKISNLNLNLNTIVNSKLSYLWNMFKLASKKANYNYILFFNNIEHIEPNTFRKFLRFGKENRVNIISTVNKVLRPSTLDILSEYDMKNKLNYFSYKQLFNILNHRISLTFSHEIDKELIEFITDLIFEHYAPVPGKGIDLIKSLYPILKDEPNVKQNEMLEICQSQFESFQISDEFSMLSFISEKDPLTILFLDNLSNFFLNPPKFYISSNQLKEIYDISCESLEYQKNPNEFDSLIKMSQGIGILNPSKKSIVNQDQEFDIDYYFMVVNPYHLKAMLDAVFSKF